MSELTMSSYDAVSSDSKVITVFIPFADIANVQLNAADRALFEDVIHGKVSNTPVADRLLALETIVRRIEEQRKSKVTE